MGYEFIESDIYFELAINNKKNITKLIYAFHYPIIYKSDV